MLAFAMGGRVAEELCFDEISTGAQNDLEQATQIARAMVAEYGMSEKVGPLSLGQEDANSMFDAPKISGDTAELIDQEVNRLLNQAHDRAVRILHRASGPAGQAVRAAARHRDDRRRRTWRPTPAGTKPIPDPVDAAASGRTGAATRPPRSALAGPDEAVREPRRHACRRRHRCPPN